MERAEGTRGEERLDRCRAATFLRSMLAHYGIRRITVARTAASCAVPLSRQENHAVTLAQ